MLRVELIPDLSHCIETVAKREHTAVSEQLLASGQINKELEEKLEKQKASQMEGLRRWNTVNWGKLIRQSQG